MSNFAVNFVVFVVVVVAKVVLVFIILRLCQNYERLVGVALLNPLTKKMAYRHAIERAE